MRKFIKEYFSFTRSEIRIIVVLTGLILISYLFRFFAPLPDLQAFKLTEADNIAIDSFINSLEKISYEKKEIFPPPEEKTFMPVYRYFDPNTATGSELEEMRFPVFLRKSLLNYRKAGGKFREKADVRKLYGFSDSLYNVWEQYIVIPETGRPDTLTIRTSSFTNTMIELNSADSASLLEIHGIGPYYAGRIISYRDRLGGFLTISQLLEIKGMDTIRLETIKNQIEIDSLSLVKIKLNVIILKDLKKHPYVSPRFAESFSRYRQFSGSIKKIDELLENRLITKKEFDKLKPYLSVEE
jgi:competence ComEA-like helix-hairpin-helix protein